ncbi:MAG: 2-amino-4-hydroxy-6-hydroxymethyldihydropteridine diphosphokinase [Candidatus Alcyoniella australis]|nr:2-amino-4-hydroxy-6-hydroxymethyldihydropteridine diphosphokinase [Candidatus Alcyoniella australis]
MTLHAAAIGLGSNLGQRRAHLVYACERLDADGLRLIAASEFIETQPEGNADQPLFQNAAAIVETALDPLELLERLLAIERERGRQRGAANAPRTLDLDLLLYDELTLDDPRLIVPHPRMHLRRFVLEPLCSIAAHWRHPLLQKTVAQLLQTL